MTTIHLQTKIKAPLEHCFNFSRDIDLHQSSMMQSKEEAIAGVATGLIDQGQTHTSRHVPQGHNLENLRHLSRRSTQRHYSITYGSTTARCQYTACTGCARSCRGGEVVGRDPLIIWDFRDLDIKKYHIVY